MAFDLTSPSPEIKKSPEVLQTPEAQEVSVEVPHVEPVVEPQPATQQPASEPEVVVVPAAPVATNVQMATDDKYARIYKKVDDAFGNKRIAPLFKGLSPAGQQEALTEGAKLTRRIADMIYRNDLKDHEVLVGTRKWLSIFPKHEKKTQKAFLEQEAKLDLETAQRIAEEEKQIL
ncbi:MAG: hypothetical protein WC813_01670 [Patescibacteria group bacterium]|jgi:hypothetical protein